MILHAAPILTARFLERVTYSLQCLLTSASSRGLMVEDSIWGDFQLSPKAVLAPNNTEGRTQLLQDNSTAD